MCNCSIAGQLWKGGKLSPIDGNICLPALVSIPIPRWLQGLHNFFFARYPLYVSTINSVPNLSKEIPRWVQVKQKLSYSDGEDDPNSPTKILLRRRYLPNWFPSLHVLQILEERIPLRTKQDAACPVFKQDQNLTFLSLFRFIFIFWPVLTVHLGLQSDFILWL
jgi:hypothetical protein